MGDGIFGHNSVGKGSEVSKLSEKYYAERYITARRVFSDEVFRKLAQ